MMKKIKELLLKIKSFIETLTIIPLHIEYGYINGFVFKYLELIIYLCMRKEVYLK